MMSEKRRIRPGDIVRQIKFLGPSENPLAEVIAVEGLSVRHRHLNKPKNVFNTASTEDFKFINSREEIIYDE